MQDALEHTLVVRLTEGSKEAFTTVFQAYYKDLTLFACTIVGDLVEAEELVQDVMAKLWFKHKELVIRESLKSYLIKTVQNRCLDELRRRRIHADNVADMSEFALSVNDAEEYILYTDLMERLDALLDRMPEELSRTFRLSRFDGKTYPEIAEEMGVAVRTVEDRMSRALKLLKTDLKPE